MICGISQEIFIPLYLLYIKTKRFLAVDMSVFSGEPQGLKDDNILAPVQDISISKRTKPHQNTADSNRVHIVAKVTAVPLHLMFHKCHSTPHLFPQTQVL